MINIKSDFKILTKVVNGKGEVLPPFSLDFEFIYTDIANKSIKYTISNLKGVQTNCKALDNNLILIFQDHGFTNFKIKETRHFYIPDNDFKDTIYDVYQDNIIDLNCINEKDSALNKHLYILTKNEEVIAPYYPGKSAYSYAIEGGYKGDEQRFYRDLAINVDAIDYIDNKYLIIPYAFVELEGNPNTENILLALGMDIETLNKVINNLATGVYDSVFIKNLNKACNFNYSLVFNSNTSWTLNIEYREENIVNKRTLERQQNTLIYRAVNSPMATTSFVLQSFYTKQEVDKKFSSKVDKEAGKGLSSNDYTTAEKQEVAKIINKVDKVEGKGLSTNDYTNDDMQDVGEMRTNLTKPEASGKGFYNIWNTFCKSAKALKLVATKAKSVVSGELTLVDNTKIPVVIEQDLSIDDNLYTNAEKQKLSSLNNYDDTSLKNSLEGKASKIDVYTKSEADAKFATLEALNSLIARVTALEAKP